eukprot:4029456-Prymnesium_polylepis.2
MSPRQWAWERPESWVWARYRWPQRATRPAPQPVRSTPAGTRRASARTQPAAGGIPQAAAGTRPSPQLTAPAAPSRPSRPPPSRVHQRRPCSARLRA